MQVIDFTPKNLAHGMKWGTEPPPKIPPPPLIKSVTPSSHPARLLTNKKNNVKSEEIQ